LNLSDLVYLLPEIILLAFAALVIGLDLIDRAGSRRGALPYVALIGLGAAALALIPVAGALSGEPNGAHYVTGMLVVDDFAVFVKATAIIGVALVILTSIHYLRGRTPYPGEFYGLLLVVMLAICLAVGSANLMMVYLSMEFLSITSYVLAGYLRDDKKSGEAAIKYFLYGSSASAVMLFGMSLLYGATGALGLQDIATALESAAQADLVWLTIPALVLLLVGFGFKSSLVPFHQWVPDAYEGAPTPITAFLSTASKAAGFAILMRVFTIAMGWAQPQWVALLTAVSIVTMTLGNLAALRQSNVKRLLAYSSIAQAGYILIGVAAVLAEPDATFTGYNGVLFYLFAYLFTNVGAFAVVIAIENATGSSELASYAGLVRRAPLLATLLFFFLISLAGIPPTGGFLGKFFVFGAAIQQQMWVLLAIAAVNSVIAAFYYLNVVRHMFLMPSPEDSAPITVDAPLTGAILLAGVVTLLLGLIPGPVINWAGESAQSLLSFLR
jgi:proton-translocating NADH-quinone oxidoreductase chain N